MSQETTPTAKSYVRLPVTPTAAMVEAGIDELIASNMMLDANADIVSRIFTAMVMGSNPRRISSETCL